MRSRPEYRFKIFEKISKRGVFASLAAVAIVYGASMPLSIVRAESLREALAAAYLFNPTLKAVRAQLRATDEGVARAKSGFRPTVIGEVTQSYQRTDTDVSGGVDSEPRSYAVTLNQPIFRGFRTLNAVKGAQALVESGREDLRFSEQQVLLNAVTAYLNVVRDQAILSLRQNNLKVLGEQNSATQYRREVGEVTETDVAQSRARSNGAQSDVSAARAQLQASRAVYAQIIGHAPNTLRNPGAAPSLPRSLEEALSIGEGENPQILSAIFRERAQDHAIEQTKGELLPSIDLQASYTRNEGRQTTLGGGDRQEVTTVTGVLTVPIYQAGDVSARIRQNIESRSQLRHQIDEARESVRANVISAWGVYTAARAQIVSNQAQVDANGVALSGVREEWKVGQRTVLDVLDAEQELLNAQVSLATSRRDLVVASYSVLTQIGRLSAAEIGLPVEQYDPTQHYREVKDQWIGWDTTVEEGESEPVVLPVTVPGRGPRHQDGDGPAYTNGWAAHTDRLR